MRTTYARPSTIMTLIIYAFMHVPGAKNLPQCTELCLSCVQVGYVLCPAIDIHARIDHWLAHASATTDSVSLASTGDRSAEPAELPAQT